MSMIGKSLAHYEITSELGRGGMGEVYRATDTKLGRGVAIKVLPEEFARDHDRVARFQREAKLLASLNHPHIAAIHGLEESDGTHFLVLELIEGSTLADRIKSGPIPVEEALKLALQIAEALEAAHEKGVIHRDLKPSNIKITSEGKVKVLDFGLAKAYADESGHTSLSNSPTLSDAATQQGIILGTAAYMSPEQAKGRTVDKRADIWAFGVVLFEMLTGRQLFTGETVSETLASVIKTDPEWRSLPPNLHPRIRFLLERCLKKEPKDRYSGISDARVDIQEVLADPGGVFMQSIGNSETRGKSRQKLVWASITVILIILAGIGVWNFKAPEPRRVIRLDYLLPAGQQFNIDPVRDGHTLAVSPDGGMFIYSTKGGLYLRLEGNLEARLIPGTDKDNPQSPFFSPDGKWVGYWSQAQNQMKKIPVGGGAPVKLCDVVWLYGATWYEDDTIIYSDVLSGIKRVSANGGTSDLLAGGIMVRPHLLPDGETVLFTDGAVPKPWRVMMRSLKTGEQKELFPGFCVAFLPTGHIVYWLDNNLYAIPFDPGTLEVSGGPVSVVEGVGMYSAISESGTLVYIPETGNNSQSQLDLVWVDRKGVENKLETETGNYHFPKISPDGTQVAVTTDRSGNNDIWIWNLIHKNMSRLTFNEGFDQIPLWTPDGKRIAFVSQREETTGVYWKNADGTGEDELFASSPDGILIPFSWSSDGKTLVVQKVSQDFTKIDIGTVSMDEDRTYKPLLQETYAESHPTLSPDGRWIAYCSDESGQAEIYVRPFPDVNKGRWQVSTNGGNSPRWSPDGRELFYLIGTTITEAVMRVPIETDSTFKHETPQELIHGTFLGFYPADFPWDIHPDGKRFLMIKQGGDKGDNEAVAAPEKINIVVNWFEELKQRVPVN